MINNNLNKHMCLYFLADKISSTELQELFFCISTCMGYRDEEFMSLCVLLAQQTYGKGDLFKNAPELDEKRLKNLHKRFVVATTCENIRSWKLYNKRYDLSANACILCPLSASYNNYRQDKERLFLSYYIKSTNGIPANRNLFKSKFHAFYSKERLCPNYAIGNFTIASFNMALYDVLCENSGHQLSIDELNIYVSSKLIEGNDYTISSYNTEHIKKRVGYLINALYDQDISSMDENSIVKITTELSEYDVVYEPPVCNIKERNAHIQLHKELSRKKTDSDSKLAQMSILDIIESEPKIHDAEKSDKSVPATIIPDTNNSVPPTPIGSIGTLPTGEQDILSSNANKIPEENIQTEKKTGHESNEFKEDIEINKSSTTGQNNMESKDRDKENGKKERLTNIVGSTYIENPLDNDMNQLVLYTLPAYYHIHDKFFNPDFMHDSDIEFCNAVGAIFSISLKIYASENICLVPTIYKGLEGLLIYCSNFNSKAYFFNLSLINEVVLNDIFSNKIIYTMNTVECIYLFNKYNISLPDGFFGLDVYGALICKNYDTNHIRKLYRLNDYFDIDELATYEKLAKLDNDGKTLRLMHKMIFFYHELIRSYDLRWLTYGNHYTFSTLTLAHLEFHLSPNNIEIHDEGTMFTYCFEQNILKEGFTPGNYKTELVLGIRDLPRKHRLNTFIISFTNRTLSVFYKGAAKEAIRFNELYQHFLSDSYIKKFKNALEVETYIQEYYL